MALESNEFSALWPTVVLCRLIPGHQDANQALNDLIMDRERHSTDMTTEYRGADFLNSEHPAIAWLTKCANVTVRDYFLHLGMDYEINWTLQGWANVNRFGDYHDYHNHPRAYLSGTYYVQVSYRNGGSRRPQRWAPGTDNALRSARVGQHDRNQGRPQHRAGIHHRTEARHDCVVARVRKSLRAP